MATALCGHPTESDLGGKPDSDHYSGPACRGTAMWAPESRELGESCPRKHSSFCRGRSAFQMHCEKLGWQEGDFEQIAYHV